MKLAELIAPLPNKNSKHVIYIEGMLYIPGRGGCKNEGKWINNKEFHYYAHWKVGNSRLQFWQVPFLSFFEVVWPGLSISLCMVSGPEALPLLRNLTNLVSVLGINIHHKLMLSAWLVLEKA